MQDIVLHGKNISAFDENFLYTSLHINSKVYVYNIYIH